jgi:single-strand DNA-binding protein
MSQGGYVTLTGYVAREPILRKVSEGLFVADVRIGSTPRYLDRKTGEWRDGETSYYTVSCWRRLAGHVRASLHKGDPVLVRGRFRTRTYEDKQQRIRTEVEIVADTIGHDLSRGTANYMRPEPPRPAENNNNMADDSKVSDGDVAERGGNTADGDDYADDDVAIGHVATLPSGDPEVGERFDEEAAVEEFNRELEEPIEAPLPV